MFIILIFIVIFIILFIPKLKTFIQHHYCSFCHSWTKLILKKFEAEYVVTGHDQEGLFTGLFKSLKILGLFGGINYRKDKPFLRFFGTGHYFCPKCNHEIILEEHRDKR